MRSHSSIIGFNFWANEVSHIKKSFPIPVLYIVLPMFSSRSFSVLVSMFRSLIHLGLFFLEDVRYRSNFLSSTCGHSLLQVPFVDDFFSTAYGFGIFVKYEMTEVTCTSS